jgi:hypothetical protein
LPTAPDYNSKRSLITTVIIWRQLGKKTRQSRAFLQIAVHDLIDGDRKCSVVNNCNGGCDERIARHRQQLRNNRSITLLLVKS